MESRYQKNLKLNSKILIIASEFPPGKGGIGKHAYDLARILLDKGPVTVFAKQYDANIEEIEAFNTQAKSFGINVKTMSRSKFIAQFQLMYLVLIGGFVDIYCSGRSSLLLMWPLKLSRVVSNFKVFVHGSELAKQLPFHQIIFRVLSRADKIYAVSRFTKSLLTAELRQNCEVIPNGIMLEEWNKYEELSKQRPLTKDNLRLLTIGSLTHRKGQQNVINHLPTLAANNINTSYTCIGNPINIVALNALVQSLALTNVDFKGIVASTDELVKHIIQHDIFLMLSETTDSGDVEGFGIAILEANFFGLPAIGSKNCGIEDAIIHGYNGLLIDSTNSMEFLRAVSMVRDNYAKFSQNAVNHAKSQDFRSIINKGI